MTGKRTTVSHPAPSTPAPYPSWRGTAIRAVLFDVDGTLYRQTLLRMRMAVELALLPFSGCPFFEARRTWRALRIFRRVREELREPGAEQPALADRQFAEAARRSGIAQEGVEKAVDEWILRRPLRHLAACRRPGLEGFLRALEDASVSVGAFSDYPVAEKLAALGVDRWFSLELCATDPEIDQFKPGPAGFLAACARWGLAPAEVLYIGDRPEVDAVGAARVDMPCAILGSGRATTSAFEVFPSFEELLNALQR